MNHFTARRLLPSILDHTLPARLEAAVRGHVDRCGRCQRTLAEFEACEELLAQLPAALVPIELSAEALDRLAVLARWSADPKRVWQDRIGVPALASLAAAAMLAMMISLSGWGPMAMKRTAPMTVAAMVPDSHYLPTGWRWQ